MGVSNGKEVENDTENVSEKIMVENFLNLEIVIIIQN